MEIILKQDVKNLGFKDELVTVKSGYARNYLLPKGIAIQATETNKKVLAETIKQRAFKEEKLVNEANAVVEKLEGKSVTIGAKVSSTGKIFGSVNNIQVAEALKKEGFDVDKKNITVPSDIKEVGNYKAQIKLYKKIGTEVAIEVVAE